MKLLPDAMNEGLGDPSGPTAEAAASLLLEVMPAVMRQVKAQMAHHRDRSLSLPQVRALAAVGTTPSISLSAVAEHVGLSLPAASRMVDDLEQDGLVQRGTSTDDRRRLTLTLTPAGERLLTERRGAALADIAARLSRLAPAERAAIVAAMRALAVAFAPESGERRQPQRR